MVLIDGDIVWKDTNGYLRHSNDKYVHRTVVEKIIGRALQGTECIHHVDFNKENNDPNNLVLCPDQEYHLLLHARQRILNLGGHPNTHAYCSYHKCLHTISEFSTRNSWSGLHNTCRAATNEYRKKKGMNRDKFDWRARLNQQYRRVLKGYTNRQISLIHPKEVHQ